MFKKMCMVLAALMLSVAVAGAQEGFVVSIRPQPDLALNSQNNAAGGVVTAGGLYRAILPPGTLWPVSGPGGNFQPEIQLSFDEPGGQWGVWRIPEQSLSSDRVSLNFYMPTWSQAFGNQVKIRVWLRMIRSNAYTADTTVPVTNFNPSLYACVGTQSGYAFATPRMFTGSTLPYNYLTMPEISNCTTQNSSLIQRGQYVIFGGAGLAYYPPNIANPTQLNATIKVFGTNYEWQFVSWYETSDKQHQMLFYVPANFMTGSQVLEITVNGQTGFFLATFY